MAHCGFSCEPPGLSRRSCNPPSAIRNWPGVCIPTSRTRCGTICPVQARFPGRESTVIHCGVGIMAYNEEANIGRLLAALSAQKTRVASLDEIVVVASGCTDRTEAIVQEFAARDRRVRLLTQARKEGK